MRRERQGKKANPPDRRAALKYRRPSGAGAMAI